MDDGIFPSPSDAGIDQVITEIRSKFDIGYQETLDNYIEFNIEYLVNSKINLSQPHLIEKLCRTQTSR